MHFFTFLQLPAEIRQMIFQYSDQEDLRKRINLVCKQFATESEQNPVWSFRLKKDARPPHYLNSKERFVRSPKDISPGEGKTYPLWCMYDELSKILGSSTSMSSKTKQLKQKTLKNPTAAFAFFSDPKFWSLTPETPKKRWSFEELTTIAKQSFQNALAYLQSSVVIGTLPSFPAGNLYIVDLAEYFLKAGRFFLESDELIKIVISPSYINPQYTAQCLAKIPKKFPNLATLFLERTELVAFVRKELLDEGEETIQEIHAIASRESNRNILKPF